MFLIQFLAAREELQVDGTKGQLALATDCFHFANITNLDEKWLMNTADI